MYVAPGKKDRYKCRRDCAVQIQCLYKKTRRKACRADGWRRRKRDREQPVRSYGTFNRTKEATIGSNVRRRFIKIRIYRHRPREKGLAAPKTTKTKTTNSGGDKNTSPLASTPCRLAPIPRCHALSTPAKSESLSFSLSRARAGISKLNFVTRKRNTLPIGSAAGDILRYSFDMRRRLHRLCIRECALYFRIIAIYLDTLSNVKDFIYACRRNALR